jgi:hypothetical protein
MMVANGVLCPPHLRRLSTPTPRENTPAPNGAIGPGHDGPIPRGEPKGAQSPTL